jgi:hypothetical protein
MSAQQSLARLRFEDPQAAAAAADGLWAQLAIEDPRMFAALWRRANKPSRRAAHLAARAPEDWAEMLPAVDEPAVDVPAVEAPPIEAPRLPAVNLAQPAIVLTAPPLELSAALVAPASW